MTTRDASSEPPPTPPITPFALAGGQGERLTFGDVTLVVRASAESTAGAFTVFEELPPLSDVARHVHQHEDEVYYVLDGEHEFECGGRTFRLGPGGLVFLPRGIPHAHRRVVPRAGHLLSMTTPAGLEGFFRLLARAARAGELDDTAYTQASARHGIRWLS
ncbi:cupin domain-containing protein [Geodermatophilus sp. URMC 61]|uniref:cupin domain-containing protein n=1 Tax=Geodermatophilus sp. URMC 61 TaxID=3423411 RepID=UPI00406BFD61